jgi:hypothetical protein
MPRYALSQTDLLRLVVLATGVDTAKPDEAMAILRKAEYLSDTPPAKPETPLDLATASMPASVIDGSRVRIGGPITGTVDARPKGAPVTGTDAPKDDAEQGDAPQAFQPAKPE